MSDGRAFQGSVRSGKPKDGRVSALVALAVVVFVGVAIAKPWGSATAPSASVALPTTAAWVPAASASATTPPPVARPAPSTSLSVLPVAFTTAMPQVSTWTGLRWRRLASDDPLSLVTSVTPWRHGFVAVGWVGRTPATPVWTSPDGSHWDPLISGTATTFWSGLAVLGLADLPAGLVAITEFLPYCGGPCSVRYVPPVVSWVSADGERWTHRLVLPQDSLLSQTGAAPLVASGPAGLIVSTSGMAAHLATTKDGTHWQHPPTNTLPPEFWLNDLRGTATGYVAVGRWTTNDAQPGAGSLWSADGHGWSRVPISQAAPSTGSPDTGSTVDRLVMGRNGMVAVGRDVTAPGATLWWQSADGRRWQPLPTLAPLGPATCAGSGCSVQPNGTLVGDGQRMLALRGGVDAGAWTSTDGLAWQRLAITGVVPSEQATQAVLLPGGVILSDGTTTWLGEASGA